MITIGENLKLERFEVESFEDSEIKLKNVAHELKIVTTSEILKIELLGIKSNSGYCGTMEWGMKNPTFILPTNFWYTIVNWFKRQDDDVYYKMTLMDEDQFIVCSGKKMYKAICNKGIAGCV